MNPNTGQIVDLQTQEDIAKSLSYKSNYVPITEEQKEEAETMEPQLRKGYMRNQPCPCGSGVKFKRCHWDNVKDLHS